MKNFHDWMKARQEEWRDVPGNLSTSEPGVLNRNTTEKARIQVKGPVVAGDLGLTDADLRGAFAGGGLVIEGDDQTEVPVR